MKYGEDWPIGAVIEMFDEQLRILKNWGTSGEVEYLDGEFVSNNFYWEYQGEKAKLISLPENEGDNHIFMREIMDAHWLQHDETDMLFIIAREGDGFESYNGDGSDLDELLMAMPDSILSNADAMKDYDFTLIPEGLRRFNPEIGYYHA